MMLEQRTILISGGTGFTGSFLAKRMLASGHRVRLLDNKEGAFLGELAALGAEITLGSVTDQDLVQQLTDGTDVVFHLAAAFRQVNLPRPVYWNVNVEGTRNLLKAAETAGVSKFVYCSTCGVHGNIKQPPANEASPIEPADYYQYTKYEGEQVAKEFMARGLDITILRPAAIYGPGDPERWLMLFRYAQNSRFLMFGNGETTYHPLYVENLVDAFELAMTKQAAKGQTYLIADENYYTLNNLVKMIGVVLDLDVNIIHLPFRPLWLAAYGCELIYKPLKSDPPLFRRRVDWFRQARAFDISKAKQELGYQPKVDLLTGLTETARWYREQSLIV